MKTFSVYGPPGCGKTTEMLRRVSEARERYDPKEISFLSFTKAAASEALSRLGLVKSDRISTIHSLMFKLTGCTAPSVVDTTKLKKFGDKIGFVFRGMSNDTGEQMELGDKYLYLYSKCVNRRSKLHEEYYESDRPGNWAEFQFFCESYEDFKKQNGYIDFNDMLLRYVNDPCDHGASVIFIDEAQDLSNLQWTAIERMAQYSRVKEIHIAGDDDQAIYEWSGANTHGMQQFEDRHDSDRMILSQSWRVPRLIHKKAMQITDTIENRVIKEYKPRDEMGSLIRTSYFEPSKYKSTKDDVLVLCRNYVTRKEVEDELIRRRIPYRNEGGMPGLFNSKIANAIRAFKKMQSGEPITAAELTKIYNSADDRTRNEIDVKEFTPMLKRGFIRSLVIPPTLIDFYREADLETEPNIRLSTIHASKGREADHVVLHTGLTMKTLNDMDKNPDAEARVWYVGVTRARQTLEILEGDMNYGI
jgi:DNA helicase-2/ATP-dependent DNA helicase PcrA